MINPCSCGCPYPEHLIPKYSGPNRSGICVCGCKWDRHHLGLVAQQYYIDATKEGYILGECCAFGHNETGGLKYNNEIEEWEPHCFGYKDTLDTTE